jgi:capsular polysaccharide biosynthesis protein
MKINEIDDIRDFTTILKKDKNGREINLYDLKNCQFNDSKTFYPDVLIYSNFYNSNYNPINETIMSLKNQNINKTKETKLKNNKFKENNPVFYFIYNTENYYHFIYDTLPYLITYNKVKTQIPNLKLLINYPNQKTKHTYRFVLEFLNLIGINDTELIYVDDETIYDNIYISSSYTHGYDSNLPPREEIYDFFREIVQSNVKNFKSDTPKKIYISRRSWLHNDYSNIGTNYTLKRRMSNEDELVNLLVKEGYEEIFTENLTTIEKLNLFYNAKSVIGAIGGGLCNVLFSKQDTNLLTIVSPTFLDVNYRFKYSLDGVKNTYCYSTNHIEKTFFKTGMRVECESLSIVGEIIKVKDDVVTLIYSDNFVSGWNSQIEFKQIDVKSKLCKQLDDGLNSPFLVNIVDIKNLIV